jgi:hypothetical protein
MQKLIAALGAAGLVACGLGAASTAQAAPARPQVLYQLCAISSTACMKNNGLGELVTQVSSGSGYALASDGGSWNGHATFELVVGTTLCLNAEAGAHTANTPCGDVASQRWWEAAVTVGGDNGDQFVSVGVSNTEGKYYCVTADVGDGYFGNAACSLNTAYEEFFG